MLGNLFLSYVEKNSSRVAIKQYEVEKSMIDVAYINKEIKWRSYLYAV